MSILFSSEFDSGNGTLVSINDGNVVVNIADDVPSELEQKTFKQWFHFRLSNVKDKALNVSLPNASTTSFAEAWEGYDVCTSYDRKTWFRHPAAFSEATGAVTWSITPTSSQVYFAYFPPYSREQHLDLIAFAGDNGGTIGSIGKSIQGRDLDLITVGAGKRKVWFIARQHPGESQGEWFMDGLIHRLLNNRDAVARHLLEDSTFYIVPNINPDGSYLGHLRTNANGSNLNREWCPTGDYRAPTAHRSPEVLALLEHTDRIGCDLFMDVHGDETLPYNFVSGMEGCAVYGPRLEKLHEDFHTELRKADPNFQSVEGYSIDKPNTARYQLCSKQIGQRYDCLALTLEMPYKDVIDCRGKQVTFLDKEAITFGAQMLEAVKAVLPALRDD